MSFKAIKGYAFGYSLISGQLQTNGGKTDITHPAVDAVVTVGDEAANVRQISIQLRDARGNNINRVTEVEIGVFLNNNRTAYVVTGGSTGIAIGASGALLAVVAKKRFLATSTAAGLITLTYTDTADEAGYIGVKLPNGNWVMGSQALTNAA